MDLSYILGGIIVLFFIILIVRNFMSKRMKDNVCSICFASSITWIILLVLYHSGKFENIALIALLMGMTLLGLFYLFERNIKEEYTFFRLPLLLTLITFGYFLLTFENILNEIILLLITWIIFEVIYSYKKKSGFGKFVDKIVECCKRW